MNRRTHTTDPRIADGYHRASAARLAARVLLVAVLAAAIALVAVAYTALGGAR